jgi:hypothetical protein
LFRTLTQQCYNFSISYNRLRHFPLLSRAAVAERISQPVEHVALVVLGDSLRRM